MNCKPGDLAVMVRSKAGNEGKVVTCLRLASAEELAYWAHNEADGPVWFIDQELPRVLKGSGRKGGYAPLAKDRNLRPIRDSDGEDETLTWASLPHKQGEPA